MPGMCLTFPPCIPSDWPWSSTSPGLFAWGPQLGAASLDQGTPQHMGRVCFDASSGYHSMGG